MDAKSFDELVKQVGTARVTRLSAIRGMLAGATLAIAGATLATDVADAKRHKKSKSKKRRKQQSGLTDSSPVNGNDPNYGGNNGNNGNNGGGDNGGGGDHPTCYDDGYEYGGGNDSDNCCHGRCDYLGTCGECPIECDSYGDCPDEPCSTWECVEVTYDDGYGRNQSKSVCRYTPSECEEKACKTGYCDTGDGQCHYDFYCDSDECCEPRNHCEYATCNTGTGECSYAPVVCDNYYSCDPYASNYDEGNPCGYPDGYTDSNGKTYGRNRA